MELELNKPVANLDLTVATDTVLELHDLKGKHIVLYFYPKDDTPGCTQEGKDFTESLPLFKKLNTLVYGVSRDSLQSHQKFKDKYCFQFDLISDADEKLCNYFNVIKLKNMYGKKVRGVERSTFLIDKKGVLRKEWRNVKVANHVQEVLEAVKMLD